MRSSASASEVEPSLTLSGDTSSIPRDLGYARHFRARWGRVPIRPPPREVFDRVRARGQANPIEEERDANSSEVGDLAMRTPLPDRDADQGGRQACPVPGLRGDRFFASGWAGGDAGAKVRGHEQE